MEKAKSLEEIFGIEEPSALGHELKRYLSNKQYEAKQPLTEPERIFYALERIGGEIVSDGFICLFNELWGPEFFAKLCAALTEVGGLKLRDLLLEAWEIYTQGKKEITVDELQSINISSFNTEEKMDRFDQIGDEVMEEIQQQYDHGKRWSVEYAKKHRDQFKPIEKSN